MPRPFRMWLYPLPAVIALAGWAFLFWTNDTITKLYALGVIVIGLAAFAIWARTSRVAERQ